MYIRKAGTVILALSVAIWFLMSFPRVVVPGGGALKGEATVDISRTFAGRLGNLIEPALKPLGFDWRIGIALTAGFAAKEVVVSTLATIYSISDEEAVESDAGHPLQSMLRDDPMFNRIKAYGLMLFILIYVPCLAMLAVVKREAGGMKWVAIMAVYTVSLAWIVSYTFITIATHIAGLVPPPG